LGNSSSKIYKKLPTGSGRRTFYGSTKKRLICPHSFYKDRPTELLTGEDESAEDLHYDCLDTALEALYEEGITDFLHYCLPYAAELNQVVLSMITTYGASIPVWIEWEYRTKPATRSGVNLPCIPG